MACNGSKVQISTCFICMYCCFLMSRKEQKTRSCWPTYFLVILVILIVFQSLSSKLCWFSLFTVDSKLYKNLNLLILLVWFLFWFSGFDPCQAVPATSSTPPPKAAPPAPAPAKAAPVAKPPAASAPAPVVEPPATRMRAQGHQQWRNFNDGVPKTRKVQMVYTWYWQW